MSKPRVITIKCCKHCGSGLGVEECGTYCPNYENNNAQQRIDKLKKETQMAKKKVYRWCLSVDLEGGDGADLFPIISTGKGWINSKEHIDAHFSDLLYSVTPPPKVTVVGLTEAEWKAAKREGRRRDT